MFQVNLQNVTNGSVTTAPIHSCCQGNSISFWMPGGVDLEQLRLLFVSPVNTRNHMYYLRASRTPTGTITSANNISVGANQVEVTMTNTVSATVETIFIKSTISPYLTI